MISKRLQKIADFIPEGSEIIDVGCDHAYLDIYLTKYKKCNCIASDINQNALNCAIKNIKKNNLENKIKTIISDGLSNIVIEKKSIVVITGMGTKTILDILKKCNDNMIESFIISTHTDYENFRKNISQKYHIVKETIIEDKKIFYLIMQIEKGSKKYSKKDLYLGPVLKMNKEKDTINFYKYLFNQNQEIINKLDKRYWIRKRKLKKQNKWIKKLNRLSI